MTKWGTEGSIAGQAGESTLRAGYSGKSAAIKVSCLLPALPFAVICGKHLPLFKKTIAAHCLFLPCRRPDLRYAYVHMHGGCPRGLLAVNRPAYCSFSVLYKVDHVLLLQNKRDMYRLSDCYAEEWPHPAIGPDSGRNISRSACSMRRNNVSKTRPF